MRIAIFGAGAVGGQLAARLTKSDMSVSVIARGAHLEAMRTRGLKLIDRDNESICHPLCTDDPAQVGEQDIVVVTVKTTSLASVSEQIAPLLGTDTQVVFAMNGMPWWFTDGLPCDAAAALRDSLDPGGRLRRVIGLQRTIGCSINSGSTIVEPGVVRSDTPERNSIILGKPDGSESPVMSALATLLTRAGYPTRVTPHIRDEMWPKLMTHACRPPICALTGMSTRQLAHDAALLSIVEQMLQELIELGHRLKLSFTFDLAKELARKPHGDHVSSFVQDLQAGRRPEIGSGILAMRGLARAADVRAPMLETISALVSARVSSVARA